MARVLVALAAVTLLLVAGRRAATLLPEFTGWLERLGAWAPAGFVVGYAVATVVFVPGSLLTLAAGAIPCAVEKPDSRQKVSKAQSGSMLR